MPARNEIQEDILRRKATAQDDVRRCYLRKLSELTGRDTVLYASAFTSPKSPHVPGIVFTITPDDIQGFMSALHGLTGDKLDLILHSPGGSMEAADQEEQLANKALHLTAVPLRSTAASDP